MPANSGGTIKSQGQLDGKFMAQQVDKSMQGLEFSMTTGSGVLFQPQPQDERDDRNAADAGEPQDYEPDEPPRE
jgi:hypothetical protein